METKKINNTIIIRIDRGEELVSSFIKIAEKYKIKAGFITGLGAADEINMGLFKFPEKKYYPNTFKGNFEITNLTGNITTMDKKTYIHCHISIGDDKQKLFGGHLNTAVISGTFEGYITIIESELDRYFDEETGLNLIKL
jgi:uncharacterized protein